MQIIYLDTETTDRDPNARLVQLAYKIAKTGKEVNEYFKPPVPISIGAMAIHHVTNEMVVLKPEFMGSKHQSNLEKLLKKNILTAHNAPFDINILQNEGMKIDRYIDTLRVARHVLDSEQYNLQYLRYSLKLNVPGSAHDAMGDVLVLEALFNCLVKTAQEKFSLSNDKKVIDKFLELTKTPALMKNINFGKHAGKSFEEISETDRGYLLWLHKSESQKDKTEQNEELVYTLNHYLG